MYQSQQQKFFKDLKEYLIKLSNVEGTNKLILTFLLYHAALTILVMLVGLLFYIHWLVGLIALSLGVGYFSYMILLDKFDGRNH